MIVIEIDFKIINSFILEFSSQKQTYFRKFNNLEKKTSKIYKEGTQAPLK